MFTVTLSQLQASNAFGDLHKTYSHLRRLLGKAERTRSLFHPFGKAYGLDIPITIPQIANACSVEVALMALRADGNWQPVQGDRVIMRYVIEASRHVLHLFEKPFPNDERPRAAIDAAVQCLEFYSSPDAWFAEHDGDHHRLAIPLAIHAAHAALDSADAIAASDTEAEAAKYAAWAAGQAAAVAYNHAFPVYSEKQRDKILPYLSASQREKHLQQGLSASQRTEFLARAYEAADEAAEYSHLAALMSENSVHEAYEWERSTFLEILAAEDQDI